MMEFIDTCLSFPVNIFTGLMIICVLYWFIAALGLIDIDSLDLDLDPGGGEMDLGGDLDIGGGPDLGGDGVEAGDIGDPSGSGDAVHGMGALASLLFQLGLYGVPMTLIITFISLFGWVLAYYGVQLGLALILDPGPVRYILGFALFGLVLFVSAVLTSIIIKPMRRFFKKTEQTYARSIRGRVVVIRSTQASDTYGEAVYEDGGAGMLLDVRPARKGQVFKRGDRAVILDYDEATRLYSIISEDEFKGH